MGKVVSGKLNHNKEPFISSRYAKKMDKIKKEKADKMFEELGYSKINSPYVIALYTKATIKIWFFRDKTFMKSDFGATCIDMLELKAIIQKVKELGWDE